MGDGHRGPKIEWVYTKTVETDIPQNFNWEKDHQVWVLFSDKPTSKLVLDGNSAAVPLFVRVAVLKMAGNVCLLICLQSLKAS